MRFFEFGIGEPLDKFAILIKNLVGRAASKKAPSKINWQALNNLSKTIGAEVTADYETFKAIYDSSPLVQKMVKNFNADGIELNVPGSPDDVQSQSPNGGKDSEQAIDQMATSAAPQQLAQQQQLPQVPKT